MLELPSEILPNPVRFPDDFSPDEASQASKYLILVDQAPIGYLRLFLMSNETHIALADATTVQVALASLGEFAANELAAHRKIAKLTPTEERVLGLLHLPTAEILTRLCISHETFRSHTKRIFQKLGVNSRKEALQLLSGTSLSFTPDR